MKKIELENKIEELEKDNQNALDLLEEAREAILASMTFDERMSMPPMIIQKLDDALWFKDSEKAKEMQKFYSSYQGTNV